MESWILLGCRQIHSAQNSQRKPLSLLNKRTKTARITATRSYNDLVAAVGRRAAQSGLGGSALARNKQVSRPVSCLLVDGRIPCAAWWPLFLSALLMKILRFLLYLAVCTCLKVTLIERCDLGIRFT